MPAVPVNALLDAVAIPSVLVDHGEWIIAANTEARALLGREIVGRHFATVLRQPAVIAAIESCLDDRQQHLARHMVSRGVQDAPLDVTCRYVDGISNDGSGAALISFLDRADIEHAGQMRRDFVANVSHELRTPLTALIGFIETLRGAARNDSDARDRFLAVMEEEAGRMNRLVGDLLSLSRVESDERVRPTGRVDVAAQLASTLNSLKPLADRNEVTLVLTVPDDPVLISGDDDQLRQVFTNLIENALKYGGTGGDVQITLTCTDRDPALRAPAIEVRVSDSGPGVDAVHLPRLTERFYRVDTHRSRQLGGTGLGLAIAKHIVNRHRGRLRVDSEPGIGTTVAVTLPK